MTMAKQQRHPEHRADDGRDAKPAHEIDWNNPADDDLVDFVATQYRSGKDRRLPWEAQALVNLAYMVGDQQYEWNSTSRDLTERILDEELSEQHRARVQVNTIKGFVIQRISMLLGSPITWKAIPWSSEDEDRNSARISTKLLQHVWGGSDETFDIRLIEALWMMFGTGVVFPKVTWDQELGPRRVFGATDKDAIPPAIKDEDAPRGGSMVQRFRARIAKGLSRAVGEIHLTKDGKYETRDGDVRIEFVTGFEITEPVYTTRIIDAGWLIHSTFRPLEKLIDEYGDVARGLSTDNESEAYLSGYRRYYGDFKQFAGQATAYHGPAEEVLVHELWRPSAPRNREGHRCVIADRMVLKKGPNPYKHGRIPFGSMKELPDDRFRPASTVGNLVGLQDARNQHRTKMQIFLNKTIEPHFTHAKSMKLPDDFLAKSASLTEVPDEFVDGLRPVPMPQLPGQAFGLDEALRRDMQDVAGIHDATLGRPQGSQESGKKVQLLQEGDQRGNTVARKMTETGLQCIGSLALLLYWQYAGKDRLMQVGGQHMEREALVFTGSELLKERSKNGVVSRPDSFNVRVKLANEPSIAASMEKIKALAELGYLSPDDPADKFMVQQLIGEEMIFDDRIGAQRSRASQENADMLAGKEPRIVRGDNDAVHIDEHEQFTTSPTFRRKTRTNPDLAIRMELHLLEHLYHIEEKRARPEFIRKQVQRDLRTEYGLPPEQPPQPQQLPVDPRLDPRLARGVPQQQQLQRPPIPV